MEYQTLKCAPCALHSCHRYHQSASKPAICKSVFSADLRHHSVDTGVLPNMTQDNKGPPYRYVVASEDGTPRSGSSSSDDPKLAVAAQVQLVFPSPMHPIIRIFMKDMLASATD